LHIVPQYLPKTTIIFRSIGKEAMLQIISTQQVSAVKRVNGRKDEGESSGFYDDVFDTSVIDPALARKMAIVNGTIDKIGMTPFQWKLFFLNGFGYAVDSVSSSDNFQIPETPNHVWY
jgi:hypothetical protein